MHKIRVKQPELKCTWFEFKLHSYGWFTNKTNERTVRKLCRFIIDQHHIKTLTVLLLLPISHQRKNNENGISTILVIKSILPLLLCCFFFQYFTNKRTLSLLIYIYIHIYIRLLYYWSTQHVTTLTVLHLLPILHQQKSSENDMSIKLLINNILPLLLCYLFFQYLTNNKQSEPASSRVQVQSGRVLWNPPRTSKE